MRIRDVLAAAAVLAIITPLAPAFGTFSAQPSPPAMTVATATLAAPATASATNGQCVVGVSRTVNVSWGQSASTFADGYIVFRATASGGPYSAVTTIGSRTTTTWADTGVSASTTYYYRVQATKIAWRSSNSPTASVTTPTLVCIV